MRLIVLILGAALTSCAATPPAPALPSGDELRQRTLDRLLKASSLQWTVELEIEANTARLLEGIPQRQTWSFKVKGPSKAYWTSGPGMEFWYEEPTLTSSVGGQLAKREFGKEEGSCVVHALVKGGLVGWTLVHGCWGFEYDRLSNPAWDVVDGRKALVADADFKLDSPGSTNPELTGGRFWVDAETGLPLQRTYAFIATGGDAPKRFQARERYGNWKIDEPLPDAGFRP